MTFAGLRYALAAAVLVPLFFHTRQHRSVRRLSGREIGGLVCLGMLLYAVTQGAQFAALQYLRAAAVSLVLSFTPAVVALAAIPLLDESPSARQWAWILVLLIGVGIYFHPFDVRNAAVVGLGIMFVGSVANALSALLGRWINRQGQIGPLAVTTVSMSVGSAALLATGLAVRGLPALSLRSWAVVAWLAVVNTAVAFTLWNRTLRTLSATESTAINNTMLVQVAILGWAFLGETLRPLELAGLLLVTIGAMAVQLTA